MTGNTKKVVVNLPDEQVEFLKSLAKSENTTFTNVLRRSINSERFFVEQARRGCKILVEEKNARVREIVRK